MYCVFLQMRMYIHELSLCILVIATYAAAKISQIDYPVDLARCYNKFYNKTDISSNVGYTVQFRCYQNYRLKTSQERKYKGKYFGLKSNSYISGLATEVNNHLRRKRATGKGQGHIKRTRKEIRMMHDDELERYFNAINTLKTTFVRYYHEILISS